MTKDTTNSAVIRVHKDKQYTVMSNEHLLFKKPPMSLKAKGLLSMFLALPDDWNYSINGLSKICKESRDCIRSTMDELKKFGYLDIEKINGENGKFSYIYHIFEQSKTDQPDMENPHLENPGVVNPGVENPTQLNTNILNTNILNTNKDIYVISAEELLQIYKSICTDFPQPKELTQQRKNKINKRLSEKREKEFWITVCQKAQASSFIKKNHFFSFDWIIKNSENPLKIYEGNYDDKKQARIIALDSKYNAYHSKQKGVN